MECRGKILIVDDNQDILLSLNMLLKPWVEAIRVISNPERIIEFMDSFQPDVILLDMNFRKDMVSGEEGYEWLARILEHDPTSVVVFMTAYISTEKTVRAIRAGALDFVAKPWDNKRMLEVVHSAVDMKRSKMAQIQAQEHEDQNEDEAQGEGSNFIGESPQILELKSRMGRVARTDANVLITGENGTGKDVLARELHRLSKRGDQPFVSIDLGCVHEQLFESELFGHVKGAFTGAHTAKQGRVQQANGGTLFLDEIGNLSLPMQQKLLTVIERREVSPVGSNQVQRVDIRIVAATNANLHERVAEGTFREDLLYRLNTIEMHIPPLRERGGDIMLLARHFLARYAEKHGGEVRDFTAREEAKLMAHSWYGNVRELQHSVERWIIDPQAPLVTESMKQAKPENIYDTLNLEDIERLAIRKALEQANGNMKLASELLGITRYALYRKIDKHGI